MNVIVIVEMAPPPIFLLELSNVRSGIFIHKNDQTFFLKVPKLEKVTYFKGGAVQKLDTVIDSYLCNAAAVFINFIIH